LTKAQYYSNLLFPLDVYEPATENGFLPGARATGMGGAQIAAGDDGSALWYNPALLTRIRRIEISGSLNHQRQTNQTTIFGNLSPEARVSNTRFGGLWAIFPVPTERGGLTLGLSVNRVRSFDRIFRYASSVNWYNNPAGFSGWGGGEDESGSLWAWSFGGSIEVSPKASIGLSLDIFDGSDDYGLFFDSTDVFAAFSRHYSKTIIDNYTGVSGKIGATYEATNWLNLGGFIGFPASISIDQTSDTFLNDTPGASSESHIASSYRYTLPFWFGLGGQMIIRDFVLAGDVTYLDYSQLEYRSGFADLTSANMTAQKYYRSDAFNYHVGAEYTIRPADVRLRAGYYLQPIPFKGYQVVTDPHFFTFGIGFLIDKSVSLDLAFLTGSWEKIDNFQTNPVLPISAKYTTNRFLMTLSYRM
jgi:long-subunit fatty acid transport protein